MPSRAVSLNGSSPKQSGTAYSNLIQMVLFQPSSPFSLSFSQFFLAALISVCGVVTTVLSLSFSSIGIIVSASPTFWLVPANPGWYEVGLGGAGVLEDASLFLFVWPVEQS